ncbi:hypothetical protein M9H77_10822 [Catharanthus roseus]|uniref:Uncharacterized protein n=1 Tax=Catharanthus roseus TaxID=4058 RepID=A0ACC0BCV2_CATRO|nr:hypothetical protein M9H77_10822 [Catharanthus roseus]
MKSSQEPRSSSSCAACKFLKRKCILNCQFAPYFRSDEPKKFAKVHKVFGASNVSKILNEVPEEQREDTVNSLVYEAEVRLKDPVYGCIGAIASLQKKMFELQHDLLLARARLAYCVTTTAKLPAAVSSCNNNNYYNSQFYFDDHHQPPPYGEIPPPSSAVGLEQQQQQSSFEQNSMINTSQNGFLYDFGQLPFL